MERKLFNLLPFMGAFASCMFSAAFADQDDSYDQSSQTEMSDGQFTQITPTAGPRVNDGVDMFISADFILWAPRMDGLGYALTNYVSSSQEPSQGSLFAPNSGYNPGFKVGVGFSTCHDGFDVGAEYTWLKSSKSSSFNSSTSYPMYPVAQLLFNPYPGELSAGSGKWSMHFNVIDLNMGRNYFISQYLKFRPFTGFKGTWQSHHSNVTYTNDSNSDGVIEELRVTQKMTYWGFGLSSGLDSAWHFTECFSLYGDVATSLLWSGFKTTRKDAFDQSPVTANSQEVVLIDTANTFHTVLPVFELGIGLRYDQWFSNDAYHFLAQLGWELQYWMNFNQFIDLTEEGSHGDFSLQGLTVKFRFDF